MRKPKLRTYGHDGTIHGTKHVDIESNADGQVVAVWFRCQPLRFEQREVGSGRATELKQMYKGYEAPKIHAIVLED